MSRNRDSDEESEEAPKAPIQNDPIIKEVVIDLPLLNDKLNWIISRLSEAK